MISLKKNLIYQIVYQILIVITPLITSPYLSRVIGAQGIGEYSYSYSVAYFFSMFILLGVNNYGTREIARNRENRSAMSEKFWSIYTIQLIMGIIVIVLYILTEIVWKKDHQLAVVQIIYICSVILDINWLFFGLEKFRITVVRNCVVKLLTVVFIFLFVKSSEDIMIYAFIMAFGFLLSQVVLLPFAVKEILFVPCKWNEIQNNIKPLLVLFVPVLAVSIFKYMDKIMLGSMCGKQELGLYDNAEKIMSIPTGLITAIGTVMLPRITNMATNSKNKEKILEYIRLSFSGSMMMASVFTFGLATIAPTFAPWFWGEEFGRCGSLIQVISFSILFLSWANVMRTQYLIPNGKDGIFVRATIYGAFFNFIINFFMIDKYGAMGTVIGTVVAEFVLAFYQTIKCKNALPVSLYIKETIPFILSGFGMYVVVIQVSKISISQPALLFVEIITGAIVYVILSGIYLLLFKRRKEASR